MLTKYGAHILISEYIKIANLPMIYFKILGFQLISMISFTFNSSNNFNLLIPFVGHCAIIKFKFINFICW